MMQLLDIRFYCYCSLCGKELEKKFDRISEYPLECWRCMIINVDS
jgi:hypothetical protein